MTVMQKWNSRIVIKSLQAQDAIKDKTTQEDQ